MSPLRVARRQARVHERDRLRHHRGRPGTRAGLAGAARRNPDENPRPDAAVSSEEAAARVNSIAEARTTLEDVQDGQKRWRFSAAQARQPRVAIPIAAMFLLLVFLGVPTGTEHNSRVRWVREQAIPEISGLLDSTNFEAAFRLIRRAEAILPNDPTLKKIHHDTPSQPRSAPTRPAQRCGPPATARTTMTGSISARRRSPQQNCCGGSIASAS